MVVAIVAIVVVGPKDLPKLMRTFGFYAGKVRRMAADFQRQFHEAMAESEADEVRKNIEAIRANMGTTADFDAALNKPLMTGEAPRTALGAPPLDAQQAEEPATRRRRAASKTTAKTVAKTAGKPAKRKAAKSAPPPKTKARAAPKTAPRKASKPKAKPKAKPRPKR